MHPTSNNHFFLDLFEQRLIEFTGAPHVVLVDSCTNAIFLALTYLAQHDSITPTITIPSHTYVGVAQSVLNAGLNLAFSEEQWVGQYVLRGSPIIDAAVGFSQGMYRGGMVCLSFQQKKALPIGKGGAILLNDRHAYSTLKRMAWDGRDASKPVADDLVNIIPGFHMNMTPNDAATGVLLLNAYGGDKIGSFADYPDISTIFNKGRQWTV